MEKLIKSIFQSSTTEKKKSLYHDEGVERDSDNPISDRRKLSMSRSGRLKHSYKKRHSLSLELYGENEMQLAGKPKSLEYHVHAPIATSVQTESSVKKNIDDNTSIVLRNGSKSPEEEIDNAFEIIDKS